MANLNLSQFGEKLFVADADHTFIWDTAASISKRVSRNSWLSGTTADFHLGLADAASPVAQTISVQSVVAGTTNTAGTAFTIDGSQGTGTGAGGALIFRTAAAGSSGSTQNALGTALTITSDKRVVPESLSVGVAFSVFYFVSDALTNNGTQRTGTFGRDGIIQRASNVLAFSSSDIDGGNMATADTIIRRDGAPNTLALRNGAAAQTFNVYGTYTSGTSYERLTLSAPSAANAIIGTNKGSGGGTARGLDLHTDGAARMTITTAGNVGIGTTVPSTLLEVALPSTGNTLYQGIKVSRGTGYFSLGNGTGTTPNNFVGLFVGKGGISGTAAALGFQAIAGSDSDTSTSVAFFNVRNTTDNGNILDSQIAYQFRNYLTNLITVLGSGNVGIGTTSPTSKLQVTNGDVEIETVTSGIIMKAAGTSTRYRITLNAGGTALVFTAI